MRLLRNFAAVTIFTIIVLLGETANASNNSPNNSKPNIDCLNVNVEIPPKEVFNRIKLGIDLEEASVIIGRFATPKDKIVANLGGVAGENMVLIWTWSSNNPTTASTTGEVAILKLYVTAYKVSAVELEHIILTEDNIERKQFEKSTLKFINDQEAKK